MHINIVSASHAEHENIGPGSHLISLSYSALPLSVLEAFRGSRLSLSFGENELSWRLHYFPILMWAHLSHTTISWLKPNGNAQWSVPMFIRKSLAFLQSTINRTVSVWQFTPQACVPVPGWIQGTFWWRFSNLNSNQSSRLTLELWCVSRMSCD